MLSKKTKYALHALVHLGRKFEEDKKTLIGEISEQEKIPKKFLEAILLELRKAGVLGSKKGKHGGYYMIRHPKEVDLASIVRLINGPIALLPCVSKNYFEPCDECIDTESCGINSAFIEVRDETLKVLENRTIQDIIDQYK